MPLSQYFKAKDKDQDGNSVAEKTAADWIRPGGGYDTFKKDDPAREKILPPGGSVPEGYKPGATRLEPKPGKKRMTFGQRIAKKD